MTLSWYFGWLGSCHSTEERGCTCTSRKTSEVVENVQTFLDLAIETQEVISCLEDLNPDVELSSGLNSDPFNREGVGYGVSCALDKDTEFAVFHLMADA